MKNLLTNNNDTKYIDDDIKDTKLMYINSNMSSVSQIITEYSKYMNYKIDPLLATILLAAIEVDTNRFKFKTTEFTYEIAAYLTTLGADIMFALSFSTVKLTYTLSKNDNRLF